MYNICLFEARVGAAGPAGRGRHGGPAGRLLRDWAGERPAHRVHPGRGALPGSAVAKICNFNIFWIQSKVRNEYNAVYNIVPCVTQRICSPSYSLTEDRWRAWSRELFTGLAFLHSRAVIHLDIKPNNLVSLSRAETAH